MGSEQKEELSSEHNSKFQKKLDKKQNKYKHMVLECPGIEHSCQPSKFMMVCNAGLVSGVDEGQLVQLFSKFGQLDSVTMLVGKSYCFVAFKRVVDSQVAYYNINGKHRFPKQLGPAYLMYTTAVPAINQQVYGHKPGGIILFEEFVSEEEENVLLNCIDWSDTESHSGKSAVLKHRRVKHYGYEFNYSNNNVNKNDPLPEKIPDECCRLKDKLESSGWCHLTWPPDQLTVNEYLPGQGIPAHVDTHSAFKSPIISLSLGSDVVMDFKHLDGRHIPIHLPRRSLLIMDGEARYDWTHGITPRKMDVIYKSGQGPSVIERGVRTSFTFRWLLCCQKCNCSYPDLCDSQHSTSKLECSASRLESLHVHQVYNEISSHFSQTRYKAWPNVSQFIMSFAPGSFLFDVGCGNGKYFGTNKKIFELGCDRSSSLAEVCNGRGYQVIQCDCLQLPLRTGSVDAVISIAVIHHLSTRERRIDSLKEMARVLQVGGQGLVYVWAKDQQRNNISSTYLKQDKKNMTDNEISINTPEESDGRNTKDNETEEQNKEDTQTLEDLKSTSHVNNIVDDEGLDKKIEFLLPIHSNRTQFKHEDLLVPWTFKERTFYRYYHVFKEGELEELCQSITSISIVKSYYDQGNWCVVFQKNNTFS